MSQVIQHDKFVELTYKVVDQKSGQVLTAIEYPLGYVHGRDAPLALELGSRGDKLVHAPLALRDR